MELFVEYFVVLMNGLLFMTTKDTRIDLIGLVYTFSGSTSYSN